ncbi:MAG TPA: hypothetical protein VNJ52_07785 [Patescibacteria group bacterium]|nr:hypothetical protein [Patescibacteria group bacterium]
MNPRLLGLLFFCGSLYLAYIMAQWVLDYRPSGLGARVAVFCGLGVVIMVLRRWRFGVFLFLLALTFEDLFRKYLGNSMGIYFVKDLLLAVVYGAFAFALMKRRERLFRPSFRLPLLAFATLAIVQMFNPRTTSIFYGLLGMEIYLYYVPLIFIGYALLSDQNDLDHFLTLNLKIACIVAGVGIVQASGHRYFLNPVNLAPALQDLGHLVRLAPGLTHALRAPPSVFVSQGRYGNYLEMMFTLALGTAGFQLFRRRSSRWTYLSLALLGVAIFLSGSKGALVYSAITAAGLGVILLWGMRGQPWVSARLGKILRRSVIAVAAGFCLFVAFFPRLTSSWGTYYYEMLWPDSANSELGFRVGNYPLGQFEEALAYPHWVTGYGTGIASLGVEYVTGRLHEPEPPVPPVENGFGVLLVEMGIVGPILWVILSAAIVISGWKLTRRLSSTPLYPVALCIVWFAFWVLLPFTWESMTTYQNFVVNAYLWLLVGVLFRLPSFAAAAPPRQSMAPAITARPAEPVHAGQAP